MHSNGLLQTFRQHHGLLWQYTRRMVEQKYRGSMLGLAWTLLQPLAMLLVYSVVFVWVFKARWGIESGPRGEFAVILFSGLIAHAMLAETLTRCSQVIVQHVTFVKQVVFPLELLPVAVVLSALFQLMVSLIVLMAGVAIVYGSIPWTVLFLPLVILPFVVMLCAIGWFLAALGVFFRDITTFTAILVTVSLFLSTVFYPASKLPGVAQYLLYLNPLSFVVDQLRAVLLEGASPDWYGLLAYSGVSLLLAWLAHWCFRKWRPAFADVM